MSTIRESMDLEARILKTLHLADRRNYGLTLEQLSRLMVGGEVDTKLIERQISKIEKNALDEGIIKSGYVKTIW